MKNFKKDLACNISLIVVLVFTAIHLLLLTLNIFGVTNFNLYPSFNYIIAYVLVIVCLALYILSFFTCYLTRIEFPAWLRIVFYVALFLFTNTYYICNAFNNIFGEVFLFAYVAFLISITSVSVFYNVQKDDNYKLKASKEFITTSVFFYSLGADFIILTIVSIIKAFAFGGEFASLVAAVVELCTMLLVTIVMSVVFDLSLAKSKKFINACLVKTKIREKTPKSAKQN